MNFQNLKMRWKKMEMNEMNELLPDLLLQNWKNLQKMNLMIQRMKNLMMMIQRRSLMMNLKNSLLPYHENQYVPNYLPPVAPENNDFNVSTTPFCSVCWCDSSKDWFPVKRCDWKIKRLVYSLSITLRAICSFFFEKDMKAILSLHSFLHSANVRRCSRLIDLEN